MPLNPDPSKLDASQIIQRSFNGTNDKLRVEAEITALLPGIQEVLISETNDSIAVFGTDGSANKQLKTDSAGELQIDVLSSALPTGASTDALQTTGNSSLSSIDSKVTTTNSNQTNGTQKTQVVDGSGNVIGSTSNALDVNIKSGITLEVNLDNAADDVLVYGTDGGTNRAIKTDAAGELQIDVLTSALPSGAATSALQTQPGVDIGDVTVNNASGASAVNIQDGGNIITVDGTVSANATLSAETTKIIGTVNIAAAQTIEVTNAGTFATQAAQSGTWTVQPGNTANTTAWKVDGSAVTQPVSVSTLPLPSGAATSALQTQPGVDIGDVTVNNAAGASAVNIQDGGNSITVDGTVAATQSGTWNINNVSGTVSLPTGAATSALQTQPGVDIGDVTINNASGAAAVNIQDGGNSITVDGTVTANAGTNLNTSALALSATQTDRTQKSQITDGTRDGTVKAASTAAVATDTALVVVVSPNNSVSSIGNVASGATDSGNPVKVGGVYNSTEPTFTNGQRGDLQITATGRLKVDNLETNIPTYSASVTGLSATNNATDVFTITGSASKKVTITKILINGTRTSGANIDILLIKRSSANSGGTSSSSTVIPHDSNDSAGTATVLSYTANPTLGTTVGTIKANKMFLNSNSSGISQNVEHIFEVGNPRGVVLRGTSQVCAINLNGVTVAGNSLSINVEWTEE